MSGRRVPLSSNPNAANSPYRSGAGAVASKQKRSYANIQREDSYGQPPPGKKQMLEHRHPLKTPPRQHSTQSSAEGKVFTRKSNSSQQSAFERKLVSVREKPAQQTVSKADKVLEDDLRKWQKHYRSIFPKFVFYFESVPEDVRVKYAKQVTSLGAREEKFFSYEVTHVVTTRTIPPEHGESSNPSSTTNESQSQNTQPSTINPSLLDRSSEPTTVQSDSFGVKGKFTFEAPINKRLMPQGNGVDIRRQQGRKVDTLDKARELNMKIWALEKLQRIMNHVTFDAGAGSQVVHGHNTRSNTVQGPSAIPRSNREADLSQLLRNERINGPSDRDPTVATKEMNIFKGPFIYIHDIDDKLKPIMVREYAKVTNKEDGDWPQFRSVANGKCPFVEEVDHSRREAEKEKELLRLQRQQEKEKAMIPRTRAAAAFEARMAPPNPVNSKRALTEMDNGSTQSATVSSKQANPFETAKNTNAHRMEAEPSSRGQQNAFVSRASTGKLFGGEPVASGVQPSNITSAIRSQMISSTAAQPGAKAGTSKELHGLQRKVLEKNSGGPASYGIASSHRMTDMNTMTRDEMNGRPAKRKLGLIEEDVNPSDQEENARRVEATRKAKAVQQRKLEKRDPKPGYCENCQDKFEDFDEHILSRKHRKFAEKPENWKELDSLLIQLARPVRHEEI